MDASVRLTARSRSVSASFCWVRRASSAFSMARPSWEATPSTRRTSAGTKCLPVSHQTRNSAPTASPRTMVGAKRTESGSTPAKVSGSMRGSFFTSGEKNARPARHVPSSPEKRDSTKGREPKTGRRCLGTW